MIIKIFTKFKMLIHFTYIYRIYSLIKNTFFKYLYSFQHLYGKFGKNINGYYEYYLKFDGYYYCKWKKCIVVIIRVRNKRTIDELPLQQIVYDTSYISELHPLDAFVIGILANNERNGMNLNENIGWINMHRLKEYQCNIKSFPILEVSGQFYNSIDQKIIILKSKFLNKEIQLPLEELCTNQALLYTLDSCQTVGIGFDISESFIQKDILGKNK